MPSEDTIYQLTRYVCKPILCLPVAPLHISCHTSVNTHTQVRRLHTHACSAGALLDAKVSFEGCGFFWQSN
jgi:hypothetical protein